MTDGALNRESAHVTEGALNQESARVTDGALNRESARVTDGALNRECKAMGTRGNTHALGRNAHRRDEAEEALI